MLPEYLVAVMPCCSSIENLYAPDEPESVFAIASISPCKQGNSKIRALVFN